jgi:hypothetical protein
MRCRKCAFSGEEENFYFNKSKGIHERWCIRCHREYRKQHYKKNRSVYVAKAANSNARAIAKLTVLITELKNVPCMDCGLNFPPVCMDFDHRNLKTKLRNVSAMRGGALSEKKIRDEIAKCDVVCACCHRLRSHPHLNPLATNESKG